MNESSVPSFRYHPDPVATGEVRTDSSPCACCRLERGYLYTGPLYGPSTTEELEDSLCPWCIADGSAAERFGASFVDVGWGVPDTVPEAVLVELTQRTPSFTGWQQEHWLYHCDDAAAYMGMADYDRLTRHPNALQMVLHENDQFGWSEESSRAWVESMSTDGSPTAYLFRCLHCGIDLAYADMAELRKALADRVRPPGVARFKRATKCRVATVRPARKVDRRVVDAGDGLDVVAHGAARERHIGSTKGRSTEHSGRLLH